MKKSEAKRNAKFLAEIYMRLLQEVLEKNTLEKLDYIKSRLHYKKDSELLNLIEELSADLKDYVLKKDFEEMFHRFDEGF
jgi:hypothetical protein